MSFETGPIHESQTKETVEIFTHRAGWIVDGEPNSVVQAGEVFGKGVNGCEIDVRSTADGALVVTHENVSNKTLEQFLIDNPNKVTLESWIEWMKQPELEGKEIYLDLKEGGYDPYKLIELVKDLGERVVIGAKYPDVVVKLLIARKILGSKTRMILQIPDPAIPEVAVNYASNLANVVGLGSLPEGVVNEDIKPDGVHFYFPENIAKDLISEVRGDGESVPVTDKNKPKSARRFPNIFGLHNLQRERLKRFTQKAKAAGFKYVFAGSAESAQTNQRMIGWGVNAIMPNNPDVLPVGVKAVSIDNKLPISPPEDRGRNEKKMVEANLEVEMMKLRKSKDAAFGFIPSEDKKRLDYLESVVKLKKGNSIRMQLGF